ncbi:MAG: hypothetical protein ACRDUY_01360 [Nitriliruptorales bacterium]
MGVGRPRRESGGGFEAHLEEVIGVEEAAAVADRFDRTVTREYLDRALGDTR